MPKDDNKNDEKKYDCRIRQIDSLTVKGFCKICGNPVKAFGLGAIQALKDKILYCGTCMGGWY